MEMQVAQTSVLVLRVGVVLAIYKSKIRRITF